MYYGKTHSSPLHLGLLPAEELCNSHKIHQTSHKVIEKIYRSMTNESLHYELNWPFQSIFALLLQMTQNHVNCESKGLFTSSESGRKSEEDQRTSKKHQRINGKHERKSVADLRGHPLWPKVFSIPCSFWKKRGKFVYWRPPSPLWSIGAPSYGNSWNRPWKKLSFSCSLSLSLNTP